MTDEEAIDKLRDLHITPSKENIRAIKNVEKKKYYRWRSNPNDLPKDERDVLAHAFVKDYGECGITASYDMENTRWISSSISNDFTVIEWKYIEPYEGD